MVEVELVGLVYELAGCAEMARNMVLGLGWHGVTVALRTSPTAYFPVDLPDPARLLLEEARQRNVSPYCPMIQIRAGDGFQPIPGRHVIGMTMLESDRINAAWVAGCNRVQEVWVPSEFNRSTFTASGARHVRIMPLGVDAERFRPGQPPFHFPWKRSFSFLTYDWFLRKGPDLLLHAYFRTFSRSDDVVLAFKIKPTSREEAAAGIASIASSYGGAAVTPPVVLIDDVISWAEMPRLYNSVDCFVLPTRGEGWSLPVIEAMASGLPVICTAWSGPTQFLNAENAFLIPVETLEPIPPFADNDICRQNGNWARPSLSSLMEHMHHVYTHREEAKERGRIAREQVVAGFTWAKATERMAGRLREIAAGR